MSSSSIPTADVVGIQNVPNFDAVSNSSNQQVRGKHWNWYAKLESSSVFNQDLKSMNAKLGRDIEELRIDNERCNDKIQDLEKWIVMLSNNFYNQGDQ